MTADGNRTALAFRPDIEGLRALAILAVVGAHAGMPLMSGGFVGVDVFFVLSGYLISALLIREFEAGGSIAFLHFYARRFRRLLPGLALMLFVTALAAAVLLAPFEQPFQTDAIRMAFLWLSNVHFALADSGYFDAAAGSNLVLHTWSLGVEEQFYLVWPLLVVYFMGRQEQDAQKRRAGLASGFVLIFALSLFACVALSTLSPLWAFYSMPTRAWQFALGALVFLYAEQRKAAGTPDTERTPALAAWTGLALILGCTMLLHEDMTYPGAWALLPATGAALLLFAGSGGILPGVSAMLATRPMQAIGTLSYSWYLWHWPVLVLGEVLLPDAGLGTRFLLACASLLIAALAYALVERPVRNSSAMRVRPVLTASCALGLMLGGVLVGNAWRTRIDAWATQPAQAAYATVRADLAPIYAQGCDTWFSSPQVRLCSLGDPDAQNTAVLLGDSIGAQWLPALQPEFTQAGWRLLVLTKSACPIVDEPIFYARIGMRYTVCEEWRRTAVAYLAELKPQVIFVGSAATYQFTEEQWQAGTARILEPLAAAAEKVYVIRGTPVLPFDGPSCLARRAWQPGFIAGLTDCNAPGSDASYRTVLESLRAAAANFANVSVLDLNPVVCPDDVCRAHDGDGIVFRDQQHVASHHMATLAPLVARALRAAE